jgi:adenosylhomocysteine nucleosidase
MTTGSRHVSIAALLIAALASAPPAGAVGRGPCAAAAPRGSARIVVLSAFPAEMAPLVAAATIEDTVVADGRSYYLATIGGVRVVLGLTGIGMVNAGSTTASVLRNFAPQAIVFSGVAGSRYDIADVVVAAQWVQKSVGTPVPVNPAMLELTRHATTTPPPFANCAAIPPLAPTQTVCFPYTPMVVFGQLGVTDDPFGGKADPCTPGGDDVFGCALPAAPALRTAATTAEGVLTTDEVSDMETAVVATLASQANVPFVAMRAVSDGAGDPLGDRGFPLQFFDYYRLAAGNAALVTRALLTNIARLAKHRRGRAICHLLARHRWDRAASRIDQLP